MRPQLVRMGRAAAPVVLVDGLPIAGRPPVEIAAALAPFPPARSAYPGLRRVIGEADGEAMAYATDLLEALAPFIAGAYDCDRFDLLEASFSLVTAEPSALSLEQRAPHFDSLDPDDLAVMHYLTPTAGTAFWRQRATGIEVVDDGNVAAFVARARQDAPALRGYLHADGAAYERVGAIEGLAGRVAVYQGAFLHSGIIDDGVARSPDPRTGRLTANLFLHLVRP